MMRPTGSRGDQSYRGGTAKQTKLAPAFILMHLFEGSTSLDVEKSSQRFRSQCIEVISKEILLQEASKIVHLSESYLEESPLGCSQNDVHRLDGCPNRCEQALRVRMSGLAS